MAGRRAAAAALLWLVLLAQGGCMMNESENKNGSGRETVEDRVLAWLNERYEDTFAEPVRVGGYTGAVYRQYMVRAKKLDSTVTVEVYDPGGPDEHIWDNYVGLRYDGEVQARLETFLSDCFELPQEDVAAYWKPSQVGLADHWTMQTTVEEYMADPEAEISLTAVLRMPASDTDRERLSRTFRQKARASGFCFSGWLYFVPEQTDLAGLGPADLYGQIIFPERYGLRLYFLMSGPGQISDLVWTVPAADGDD